MVSLHLILQQLSLIQLTTSIHFKSAAELPSHLFHLKPPKRPRRKAALRETSSPSSSPVSPPPDPPLQQKQRSRGTSRQASPRPVTRVSQGDQGISAGDIYEAVRSGKSAMVVSEPAAVEQKGEGEINTWREGGAEGGMCNEKRNKALRATMREIIICCQWLTDSTLQNWL